MTQTVPSASVESAALAQAVARARDRYVREHPASRAAHEAATRVLPGGNTRTTIFHDPFPLTVRGGSGARLTCVDGHAYVDMLGEYTAALYGHSRPEIRAAIDAALDRGINLGAHGAMEERLASLICERFPSIERVRFTNSGTEANLMAVATAIAVTGRRKVLVMEGGYHGALMYFGGGGTPVNVPHAFVLGRYNDAEGAARLVDANAGELACILVEPMLGAGGCIPGTAEFLQALRDGATRAGAILIFDEVMTSRMSAGGRQAQLGITPDMTTLGKYIGGGMSFGAFGGRADLMRRYDPRSPGALPHGGTFNNNVLSMAAGVAGLSQVFTAPVADALFARGEALRARLNGAAAQRRIAALWTGLGSAATVHFGVTAPIRCPADAAGADPLALELFFFDMLARGYYFARRGMMALNLDLDAADLDAFARAWEAFLDDNGALLPAT